METVEFIITVDYVIMFNVYVFVNTIMSLGNIIADRNHGAVFLPH